MFRDTDFYPVNPEEEARARQQEEEFARRVRREVLRIERGDADEEIRADLQREAEERVEQQADAAKRERRRASLVRQFFTGTILVREGVSRSYPYMLCIAVMLFLSIFVMFLGLRFDMRHSELEREVQKLRERSIRLSEERFRATTHSAIVARLRERNIPLYDPSAPGEVIDSRRP
ncbi:MAG: FtsL-like putative cell division protein [Alistipes sp.]|nr:FtsL-like putative cell division protein [Alistipes senegalensis]MCM1250760.1 FtsL-like putative cell division protein [Alistipes sp.]